MRLETEPHPATFILFRPPTAEVIEEDEEMLFRTELDLQSTATISYKKSCPALLGTASRRLQRIHEDKHDEDSDDSIADSIRDDHSLAKAISGRMTEELELEHQRLNKKRSFLLVDVLDDVEGVRASKRQDVHESGSTLSTDSIDIEYSSSSRPIHKLRRQRSDFDVLYTNSKSGSGSSQQKTRQNQRQDGLIDCTSYDKQAETSFSAGRLRSKKSMITLSLQKLGSVPSRSRLDGIDTHEMTSFDAVLQDCTELKSMAAETVLVTQSAPLPLSDASEKMNRLVRPSTTTSTKFARHTELLKQLPDTSCRPRKSRRDLRHAKSARDMLEKYRIDGQNRTKAEKHHFAIEPISICGEKQDANKDSLRSNLRNLLGLKKRV